MAKKQSSRKWDLKAAKDLYNAYLEKGQEKKSFSLPPETIQIDDLKRKEVLDRLYELTDSIIEKIYDTGRTRFNKGLRRAGIALLLRR